MTAPTRPEPVLDWARVVANWQRITAATVGVVYAVGAVVVAVGWARDGDVQQWAGLTAGILGGVGTLLAVVMPLLGAQHTLASAAIVREQVTPLESPQNVDGHPLVDSTWHGRHEAPDLAGPDL